MDARRAADSAFGQEVPYIVGVLVHCFGRESVVGSKAFKTKKFGNHAGAGLALTRVGRRQE